LRQQRIAIDSDLVNETSGGQARVQYLIPESEVENNPRVSQFSRSMAKIRYHSHDLFTTATFSYKQLQKKVKSM
jgi:hypothetical protein